MIKSIAVIAVAFLFPECASTVSLTTAVNAQAGPPATCDRGDALSVPSMAAAGGFTHCVLNADFTKVDGAFNDPAKFIDGCGATGNRIFQAYYAYTGTQVPCYRMTIEQDNGTQVLHLRYVPGNSAPTGRVEALEFAYPTFHHNAGIQAGWPQPAGPGTEGQSQEVYTEIVFRTTKSSLDQGQLGSNIPFSWWQMGGPGVIPQAIEVDYMEINSDSNRGNGWNQSTGMREWGCGPCGHQDTDIIVHADFTQYHEFGILVTSDEKTNMAKCLFMDNVLQGCQHLDPVNDIAFHKNRASNPVAEVVWVGNRVVEPRNTVDVYIKSATIWECPTYLSTTCTGSKWIDNGAGLTYWSN